MDIDALTEQEMIQELEHIMVSTITEARVRLARGDVKMQQEYMRRHRIEQLEIPHYFEPGDLVLLK